MIKQLTDEEFEEIKSLANATIHELVFLTTHAENNECDEAKECLSAIELNLHRISELL